MRQPQEVTITWMPYPEYKPNIKGEYLVNGKDGVQSAYWSQNRRRFSCKKAVNNKAYTVNWNVTAYAELPEGYQEDK